MAAEQNARARLLCLVEILTMYSDEFNILSIEEIAEKLKEYGYDVAIRTILSDIKAVNMTTVKIISVSTPKKGYYLAKSYSQYAIHLIIESIFSSDFISESDIKYIANYLKRNTCLPSLNLVLDTTKNLNAFSPKREFSIDLLRCLRTAIKEKKKVKLVVSRIVPGDSFSQSEKLEEIIVNPLKIAVSYGSTALVFVRNEQQENAEFINLHRIKSAEAVSEDSFSRDFDVKTLVNYFDGYLAKSSFHSTEWLLLRFKSEYTELIENHFSSPVLFRKSSKDGYCVAKALTAINLDLLGWLFIHRDKIEIVSPQFLIDLFEEKGKNFR